MHVYEGLCHGYGFANNPLKLNQKVRKAYELL